MDDMEQRLRDTLHARRGDVAGPAEPPTGLRGRVHRRQVATGIFGTSGLVLGLGAFVLAVRLIVPSGEPTQPGGQGSVFTGTIVYAAGAGSDGDIPKDLYLIDAGGGAARQLTRLSGLEYAYAPDWCSNGRRIAFSIESAKRDVGTSIWVINADGTGLRQLTSDKVDIVDAYPAWSPDCSEIAFTRFPDGGDLDDSRYLNNASVHLMAADGSNERRLTSGHSPTWSPDGESIAFVDAVPKRSGVKVWPAFGLYTWELSGGEPHLLEALQSFCPDGTYGAGGTDGSPCPKQPDWSPEGRRLLFQSEDVVVSNVDGSGARRLRERCGEGAVCTGGSVPRWSPDGRGVVFTDTEAGPSWITVMRADGSGARRLAKGFSADWG